MADAGGNMLSVITPVLNGAAFIEHNIRSVQALTIPFEHIVVDGGSTDGTLDIISRYPHIKLLKQSARNGMYGAIAQGIASSSGAYIAYLNADDIYTKGIESLFNTIKQQDADIVYGNADFHFIKEERKEVFYAAVSGQYFLKMGMFPFCQSSSIFSRRAYTKAGGFRPEMFKVAGDLDLYQRMALQEGARVIFKPLVASEFLKYGESLGDKSLHLYEKEWLQLANFQAKKLYVRVLYKLARIWSRLL